MGGDGALFVRRGGEGGPVLLLLHGLGVSGDVWRGLCDRLAGGWSGSWVAPDLPGHGRSAPLARYSFGGLAAAVAEVVDPDLTAVVVGHSLGGAVGLALASGWFGVEVSAVCGLGVKVRWTDEELGRAAALAARPKAAFPSREEAAERALKVAGLTGLVDPDSDVVAGLLSELDGGWGLALDPGAFGVGAPDMTGLLGACRARVILAAGEHDPMSPEAHLRHVVADPVILPGLGHNAHVEQPEALLPILARLSGREG